MLRPQFPLQACLPQSEPMDVDEDSEPEIEGTESDVYVICISF
jgi:hypothetical protein